MRRRQTALALALQRELKEHGFRQDVHDDEKTQSEIRRQREFSRRIGAEAGQRHLPVDEADGVVDDGRDHDGLGVVREFDDFARVRARQPGVRGAHRTADDRNRQQLRERQRRGDARRIVQQNCSAQHQREDEALADRAQNEKRLCLGAGAKLRTAIFETAARDRQRRDQDVGGGSQSEVEAHRGERPPARERQDDHRDIAGVEARRRRLAILFGRRKVASEDRRSQSNMAKPTTVAARATVAKRPYCAGPRSALSATPRAKLAAAFRQKIVTRNMRAV